ncbi:Mo-dependent nitrogenase family protein [Leptolyngbya sp. NIES-3755]|nr:Mo-dependent nitrogenase family protein [Leptolyngbya sp. NIES-3755]
MLNQLRSYLDRIEINDPKLAQFICQLIPDRCPFERKLYVFDYCIQIPALCKLNPLYRQLLNLRLKSLMCLMRSSDLTETHR